MQLQSGTLLHGGTYKIDKVLGQGSFGITYLAEHMFLKKKVAIKEFFMKELNSRGEDGSITGLSDGSLSYNYAQKFRKEAQNLAGLDHPNIVRVTDCFDENGTFYYVMEYIEGQDLNTYVKQHALSESEATSIITDVANALVYMHEEKQMLHLDLKPGNIMRRNSDGHIFLIDFGLSKHYSNDGQPETSTTIGLGTAGYAPIEQRNQAKNGEFRPTIDVYALGATLYKLLTRETPPAASDLVSDDELLQEKFNQHGVSDNLSQAVIKAMLPNVKKRTQTVRSFKSQLDNVNIEQEQEKSDNEATLKISSDEKTISEIQQTKHKGTDKIGVNNSSVSYVYDENAPFEQVKTDALQGNVDAQCCMATRYYNGEGVDQNYSEAVKWFRIAAIQGNAIAQCNLGYCYDVGQGVPKNYTEAVKWFKLAAQQGNINAQKNLRILGITKW